MKTDDLGRRRARDEPLERVSRGFGQRCAFAGMKRRRSPTITSAVRRNPRKCRQTLSFRMRRPPPRETFPLPSHMMRHSAFAMQLDVDTLRHLASPSMRCSCRKKAPPRVVYKNTDATPSATRPPRVEQLRTSMHLLSNQLPSFLEPQANLRFCLSPEHPCPRSPSMPCRSAATFSRTRCHCFV